MVTATPALRAANVFRAVAQAAELCAARPADSQARGVFRQVLRRLEAELQAGNMGAAA